MKRRLCSVCHLPGHDRRAHSRRRNPDTAQLGAQFSKELEKLADYSARGKKRGAARAERSAAKVSEYLDQPKAVPHDFYTVRGKYGQLVHIPIRYDLMSHEDYKSSGDDTHKRHAAYRRKADRDARREEAEEASRKHEAAFKRKLTYDAAKAKADRERRKKEIWISPRATKKAFANAEARAKREGKTLVIHERAGGNIANQNSFARRTGN